MLSTGGESLMSQYKNLAGRSPPQLDSLVYFRPGDELVRSSCRRCSRCSEWYGFGFGFYASAIPESLQPGYWDLRGGSHLGWHIQVFLASASVRGGREHDS